ncbi:hypothetical protein JHK82_048064 [Glycine max]|nr:hypothetical protein JHK82_048064 [Glycine max]
MGEEWFPLYLRMGQSLTEVPIGLTVRCFDIALEGAEESTEDKRQRSLVALVVTCPFESLESLNNLLYSPNVDISQRIRIRWYRCLC